MPRSEAGAGPLGFRGWPRKVGLASILEPVERLRANRARREGLAQAEAALRLPVCEEILLEAVQFRPGPTAGSSPIDFSKVFRKACPQAMKPSTRRLFHALTSSCRVTLSRWPQRPTPEKERPLLTVMSANLCHDWPRYRRWAERLESFATLVEREKADVLLLQEVARTRRVQADLWIAQRLGMAYAYSKANGHEKGIGFEEGVAVFSRYPLDGPRVHVLGRGAVPFVRRIALGVTVQTPFGRILAFSAHLGILPFENKVQILQLSSWIGRLAGRRPALIGGDFNAAEDAPQMRRIREEWIDTFRRLYPDADGTTHELRWPWGGTIRRRRLDYLFIRPGRTTWSLVESRHVRASPRPYSDHHAVVLRLRPAGAEHDRVVGSADLGAKRRI